VFANGNLLGTVGEVSPKIAQNFKLEKRVALVDIPLEKVIAHATTAKSYAPIPVFPEAKRDLAIIVDHRVEYDDIARTAQRVDQLVQDVEWFDTYRGKNLPEGKKSVAMHLTFSSPDRTLESGEVDALMERIKLALKEECKAELRA
jgi:phenylalanyl-tRNA synthetase beta chain